MGSTILRAILMVAMGMASLMLGCGGSADEPTNGSATAGGEASTAGLGSNAIAERFARHVQSLQDHNVTELNLNFADNVQGGFAGMPLQNGRAALLEQFYQSWWTAFPEMRAEPQIVLVNGNHVAALMLVRGTHSGPLAGPSGTIAPTNRPIGLYGLILAQYDAQGRIISDMHYADTATMMGQLGVMPGPHRAIITAGAAQPITAIAQDNEIETANLALAQRVIEAFNGHQVEQLVGLFAGDGIVHDLASPNDSVGHEAITTTLRSLFAGMSDIRTTENQLWAAGDYVVDVHNITGTHNGTMMGIAPTHRTFTIPGVDLYRITSGRVAELWVIMDGGAMAMQLGLTGAPAKP